MEAFYAGFALFGQDEAAFGQRKGFQARDDLKELFELGGVVIGLGGEFPCFLSLNRNDNP
jgi:hypothetical protein